MIPRTIAPILLRASRSFPVVTLLGPRQSGKTTLVRALFPDHVYINLENPETRRIAKEDPRGLLRNGEARIVVDEAQRDPDILSWIQVFSDEKNEPGRFVVTGSNQPLLGEAVAQSLAGRTSVHYLLPFSIEEISSVGSLPDRDELLFRGCLPRIYASDVNTIDLYDAYFATYVERDVRRLINVQDLGRFETFMRLLAGRVGQLVNLSSLSGDVGVSSTTLGGWLSALEASFVILRLRPYHTNLGKRLVKTPKLYFVEPGLLCRLLQIESPAQVARDPLLGGIYENLVVVEALKGARHRGLDPRIHYYRDKSGFEIDLVREVHRRPFIVEVKAGRTFDPEMIASLRRFRDAHGDVAGASLLYGGENLAPVDGIEIRNHRGTADLLFPGNTD